MLRTDVLDFLQAWSTLWQEAPPETQKRWKAFSTKSSVEMTEKTAPQQHDPTQLPDPLKNFSNNRLTYTTPRGEIGTLDLMRVTELWDLMSIPFSKVVAASVTISHIIKLPVLKPVARESTPSLNMVNGATETTGKSHPSSWPVDLRNAVARSLKIDVEQLSEVRLGEIQHLDLSSSGIVDLSPLAEFASLESLTLDDNGISDLRPLSNLQSLRKLSLGDTPVADCEPLSGSRSLEELDLSHTGISDLKSLAKIASLKSLNISRTNVKDISPLRALAKLRTLDISFGEVSDLSPLSDVESLQSLDMAGTPVTDLTPLFGLKQLSEVNMAFVFDVTASMLLELEKHVATLHDEREYIFARDPPQ